MESAKKNNHYFKVNGLSHIIKDVTIDNFVTRCVCIQMNGQFESVGQAPPGSKDEIEDYVMQNIVKEENRSLFANDFIANKLKSKYGIVKVFTDETFSRCKKAFPYTREGLDELSIKERENYVLSLDKVDTTTYADYAAKENVINKVEQSELDMQFNAEVRKIAYDELENEKDVAKFFEGSQGQEILRQMQITERLIKRNADNSITEQGKTLIKNTIYNLKSIENNKDDIENNKDDNIIDEPLMKDIDSPILILATSFLNNIMHETYYEKPRVHFEEDVKVYEYPSKNDSFEKDSKELDLNLSTKFLTQKNCEELIVDCKEETKKLDTEHLKGNDDHGCCYYQNISFEMKEDSLLRGGNENAILEKIQILQDKLGQQNSLSRL
jgi:hypothetical protein